LVEQVRVEAHDLGCDPGQRMAVIAAVAGTGGYDLLERLIERDAVGRLLHVPAQALGDVVLVEEENHALLARPPLERSAMAPREEPEMAGGQNSLRGGIAADAAEGIGRGPG